MFKNKTVTFSSTFELYCKNSSISSFKYITDYRKPKCEKIVWFLINLIMFTITSFMVFFAWYEFMDNPTITTLESRSYPISKVPFPGIAICTNNKISRRRAWDFARFLSKETNKNVQVLFNNIKLLGRLYDFEMEGKENFSSFQVILDSHGISNNMSSQTYNLHTKLYNLSIPCPDLLDECHWMGKRYKCSELFYNRRTHEGYCCVFNYLRKPSSIVPGRYAVASKSAYKTDKHGIHGGLSVIINNDPDDYFYSLISSVGVTVQIFNAKDYPDMSSGSVMECLVTMGTETFLQVTPTTIYAANEVQKYPINKRKCLFNKEESTIFGSYTYSNCIVDCKVKSMLALCNCVPFMMPIQLNISACTLFDIACLNKPVYISSEKWMTLYHVEMENVEELFEDKEDSLGCSSKCYPLCKTTSYHVSTNIAPLKLNESGNNNTKKRNFVHIYFGEPDSNLYKQDVIYYWFEILSNFGGLFGVFIGLSIISLIEIVYFFILYLIRSVLTH